VPFTGLTTGIVKNSPHAATAKLFIQWLLSEEGAKQITTIAQDPVTMTNGPAPAGHRSECDDLSSRSLSSNA
jgi:ABC-type Fe3+ transport system substrate-binding protein